MEISQILSGFADTTCAKEPLAESSTDQGGHRKNYRKQTMMPNALISTALALLWSQLLFAHGQDYARMFFFQILIFGSGALGAVLFLSA